MNVFLQKILIGAFLMLTTWSFSIAQVSLIAPTLNVDDGDLVSVDIKVADFKDVVSMQFTLQWDSTVISYSGLSNFGLPEFNEGNFNTMFASGGRLTLAWIDNTVEGVSLSDSTTVFTINFQIIGVDNETTPIVFTNTPTVVEFIGYINGDDQILEVNLQHGLITINGINSSTKDNYQDYFSLEQNFPNPFKEVTYIPFNIYRSSEVTLAIYDLYGQVIYQQQIFFLAGEHLQKINPAIFPAAGIYTIKLFTPDFLATKQLIFLN